MKRIETLTTEQIDRIPEWVETWTRIGLCTDPADFDEAEGAARNCYASARLSQPTMVLRMGSPLSATIGGVYASLLLGKLGKSGKPMIGDIGRQVEDEIDRQVRMKVDRRLGAWVGEMVDERVDVEVRDLVYDKIDRQLLGHVDRQVYDHVTHYVDRAIQVNVDRSTGNHVIGQLHRQAETLAHEQIHGSLCRQTVKQVREDVWARMDGRIDEAAFQSAVESIDGQAVGHMRFYWNHYRACQLWAGWYAYVTFFRDVCGWENGVLDAFAYDEILARTCGWSWWGKDVCALSDRPLTIKRNEQGQLHCADGPAMVYRDGWAIWALGGVRVGERVVTARRKLMEDVCL